MPGPTHRAAIAGENEANEAAVTEEVAVASTSSKPKRHWLVRLLLRCIPKAPRSLDSFGKTLNWLTAVAIPLWFLGAHHWHFDYTPIRAPVWMVPFCIAFYWSWTQILILCTSIQTSSDEVGLKDILASSVVFASAVITSVVIIVLWFLDRYYLGLYQVVEIFAYVCGTGAALAASTMIRFSVNRRYFAQLGGDGGHHQQ